MSYLEVTDQNTELWWRVTLWVAAFFPTTHHKYHSWCCLPAVFQSTFPVAAISLVVCIQLSTQVQMKLKENFIMYKQWLMSERGAHILHSNSHLQILPLHQQGGRSPLGTLCFHQRKRWLNDSPFTFFLDLKTLHLKILLAPFGSR